MNGSLGERLQAFFEVVMEEASRNRSFAKRITAALDNGGSIRAGRNFRRSPPVLDPYELLAKDEGELHLALLKLDLEQLKDIIAFHGMDQQKLAMRWKSKSRLVALIEDRVRNRARKGEAFMA
jgi:hypothetical protein